MSELAYSSTNSTNVIHTGSKFELERLLSLYLLFSFTLHCLCFVQLCIQSNNNIKPKHALELGMEFQDMIIELPSYQKVVIYVIYKLNSAKSFHTPV